MACGFVSFSGDRSDDEARERAMRPGPVIQTFDVCDGRCRDDGKHCCGCINLKPKPTGKVNEWEMYCNESGRVLTGAYMAHQYGP